MARTGRSREFAAGWRPARARSPGHLHGPYPGPVTPRRLLEPSRLAPVPVDLRRVFRVGTILWAVALVASAGLTLARVIDGRQVWVSAAGIVLGFLAQAWERRRRARLERAAA